MDWQVVINLVGALLISLFAWLFNELWTNVKKLKEHIHKLEVDVVGNYAKKDELEIRLDKLEDMLNRIFDKLEKKADK